MKTGEFYYLLMVCGAFMIFGLALAANYIQYRQWLKRPGEPQRQVAVAHDPVEPVRRAA